MLLPPITGKQRTRLAKPTAAAAQWLVEVAKADIPDESLAGSIGGATLTALLELVAAIHPGSPLTNGPDKSGEQAADGSK